MTTFSNDELKAIRDNLRCAHCACEFKGSDSQALKVKYEAKNVYCSATCRSASLRNKYSKPKPNRGPCPTCGNDFFSHSAKTFCSLDCYIKSKQFKAQLAHNAKVAAIANKREHPSVERRECLECSKEMFISPPSKEKKFCSRVCYRAYMAKRFDRWVANPEQLALPQCYDEFLNQPELSCLVAGCNWHGHGLSQHMNFSHGITAGDFKRAAGFNLKSGIVSRTLAETLSERKLNGFIADPDFFRRRGKATPVIRTYFSKEASEHRKKARAMANTGPTRECNGCGISFTQSTPFGRAMYCSKECRDVAYSIKNKVKDKKPRVRRADGTWI